MKRLSILLLALAVALSMSACGEKAPEASEAPGAAESVIPVKDDELKEDVATKEPKTCPVKFEDIEWTAEEGIVDGRRQPVFEYTNNSKNTIAGVRIRFSEKKDITEEQREAFWKDCARAFQLYGDELSELKEEKITIDIESDTVVEPGEAVQSEDISYFDWYYIYGGINNFEEHMALVEPDVVTIKYLEDGVIYTAFYDSRKDEYSIDSKTAEAVQWAKSNLGDAVPKPEAIVIKAHSDNDEYFSFTAYGISRPQFNEYIEQCRALGYDRDIYSSESVFKAGSNENEEYIIDLYYTESERSLRVAVSAPEKPETPEPT